MNENNSVIEAGAAAESVSKPFGANDYQRDDYAQGSAEW